MKSKHLKTRLWDRFPKPSSATATLFPEELISAEERAEIAQSFAIYRGKAPWLRQGEQGLSLAADITSELARLTMSEFSLSLGSSPMASLLHRALQGFLSRLPITVEYACAVGGVIFKPCYDGRTLSAEAVLPFHFLPLETDSAGHMVSCAFLSKKTQNGKTYYRIEEHRRLKDGYRITNRALVSDSSVAEARPCPLGAVFAWAALSPVTEIRGLTVPLFAYFGIPLGNAEHPASPLGVPVFRRAENLLRQADLQFGRLLWEFEGGELAVDASEDAFRVGRDGKPKLPLGKERLYRTNALDACSSSNELLKIFAPDLRDKSLINGLNRIIMFVEDACGMARGSFSDPSEIARTATEIRSMKQRTYTTVTAIQASLNRALLELLEAMTVMAQLYHLQKGSVTPDIRFGDSVLADAAEEREAERKEVAEGILSASEFRKHWYINHKEVTV